MAGAVPMGLHPVWLYFVGEHAALEEDRLNRDKLYGIASQMNQTFFCLLVAGVGALMQGEMFAISTCGMVIVVSVIARPFFVNIADMATSKRIFEAVSFTAILAMVAFHVSCKSASATPDVSSMVMNAYAVMTACVMAHLVRSPPYFKMLGVFFVPAAHTYQPLWSVGNLECKLMWFSCWFGHCIGYLIERAQRLQYLQTMATLRTAEANRVADSRLNHTIKGLCGGASNVLEGLEVELQRGHRDADLGQFTQLARAMLGKAGDWCHIRQVFVQLEMGIYQSRPVGCQVLGKCSESSAGDMLPTQRCSPVHRRPFTAAPSSFAGARRAPGHARHRRQGERGPTGTRRRERVAARSE